MKVIVKKKKGSDLNCNFVNFIKFKHNFNLYIIFEHWLKFIISKITSIKKQQSYSEELKFLINFQYKFLMN